MDKINKYLVCIGNTESHRGAINFICSQIKKYPTKLIVELFIVASQEKDNQMWINTKNTDKSDLTIKAAESLNLIKEEIESKTSSFCISTLVSSGDFPEKLKEKLLSDKSINLLIIGASYSSFKKDKTIVNLIEKIGDTIMIPMIIIPENVTDEQISRLF